MGLYISPAILQALVQGAVRRVVPDVARTNGMFAWVHLDDILLVADTQEKLHSILCKVGRELHMTGFNLALRKSQLEPATILNYCCLTIDTRKAQFAVSTSRLKFFADLLVSPERFSKRALGYLAFWVFALRLSSVARTLLGHHYRQLILILKSGPWPLPRPPERVWACDASSNGMAVIASSQTIFKGSAFADHIFISSRMNCWHCLLLFYFCPCRTLVLRDSHRSYDSLFFAPFAYCSGNYDTPCEEECYGTIHQVGMEP